MHLDVENDVDYSGFPPGWLRSGNDDLPVSATNLHNLKSLNVDILKIDKSFVETLTTHKTSHFFDCGTYHRAGAQPGVKNDR